jgi:hypothetical protein
MEQQEPDVRPMEDPEGPLETALIKEFLRLRGLESVSVHALREGEATRVLAEASVYAAMKLAEIDSRAHFVHEIHGIVKAGE